MIICWNSVERLWIYAGEFMFNDASYGTRAHSFDALAFDRLSTMVTACQWVSRHLYHYFTIRCSVQTSRFSETDCPALSKHTHAGYRLASDLGLQQLPFVPGSRTCYRVVSHSRVFVIVMQTRVAIRDRRCNVVVVAVTLIVILAGLTWACTRKERGIDCTRASYPAERFDFFDIITWTNIWTLLWIYYVWNDFIRNDSKK